MFLEETAAQVDSPFHFCIHPPYSMLLLHTSSFKYNPAAVYRSVEFRLRKYLSTDERALLVLSNCRYDEVDETKF